MKGSVVPDETYFRAALVWGLRGVQSLAHLRLRSDPAAQRSAKLRKPALTAFVATSDDPEIARLAVAGGWRRVAEHYDCRFPASAGQHNSLAMQESAMALEHAAFFALNFNRIRRPLGGQIDHSAIRDLHHALNRQFLVHGTALRGRSIRASLGEYIQALRVALHEGTAERDPVPQSPQINAILLDSFRALGIDRTMLPPRSSVVVEMLLYALSTDEIPPVARAELDDVVSLLRGAEIPSAPAMLSLWNHLNEVAGAQMKKARSELARSDRSRMLEILLCDQRFNLTAAEHARNNAPAHKQKFEWQLGLAARLLAFSGLKATNSQNSPGGPGHDYVVAAFKLYGLPLTTISSGAYLRGHGSRLVP